MKKSYLSPKVSVSSLVPESFIANSPAKAKYGTEKSDVVTKKGTTIEVLSKKNSWDDWNEDYDE